MSSRKTDWEKWFYRVSIATAALVYLAIEYGDRLQPLWRDDCHALLGGLPTVAVAVWLAIKRPRWTVCGVALMLSGIVSVAFIQELNRGREKCGYRPNCQSNLKQIGLALLQYADDYEQHLPPPELRWTDSLRPYHKNTQIFVCYESEAEVGYALNAYLRERPLDQLSPERRAWTVMAYDSDAVGPAMRHDEGFNVVFADCHVKWMPPDSPDLIWNPWEPATASAPRPPGNGS